MSTQTQIIIFCVIGALAGPVACLVVYKGVNKYLAPPVNVLRRRGDIELINYNEPSQPLQAYFPINGELNSVTTHAPSYYSGTVPSYWSGTLPEYQSMDRIYVNSCLENENIINLDLILFVIIIIIIIIFKYQTIYYNQKT